MAQGEEIEIKGVKSHANSAKPRDGRFCGISLDFSSPKPLAEQFADALRDAIRSGQFGIGDILPPVREWTSALGCSAFVPRKAMRTLAREGALSVKRHVGAVVTGRLVPERRRLVVYVSVDNGDIWSRNVFAFHLGELLRSAGMRFEHVAIGRGRQAESSAQLLDAVRRGVDFALCEISQARHTDIFRRAGIPFAVISVGYEKFPGAEAVFNRVDDELVADIVRVLKRERCRHVEIYGGGSWPNDRMSAPFFSAGLHVQRKALALPPHKTCVSAWQKAALDAFDARLSSPDGGGLPDAIVFYDDFIAAGAFLAMARHGVRVPGDVKILTFSNKGLGPVFFRPLTRFESDNAANAAKIGRWIKAWLAGKRLAPPRIAARFVRGTSL
ncbi:MAG: GntR family transcriptional regulator [Kiritimatiellae bacterium]|nr:GntR family transcriptional regulator [Kiritimatiellia bacterium]